MTPAHRRQPQVTRPPVTEVRPGEGGKPQVIQTPRPVSKRRHVVNARPNRKPARSTKDQDLGPEFVWIECKWCTPYSCTSCWHCIGTGGYWNRRTT